MAHRSSCRSCRHCLPPEGQELGWCRMRQLAIHPELISELWCHHWTPRPPRLPVLQPTSPGGIGSRPSDGGQLSLGPMLEERDRRNG